MKEIEALEQLLIAHNNANNPNSILEFPYDQSAQVYICVCEYIYKHTYTYEYMFIYSLT